MKKSKKTLSRRDDILRYAAEKYGTVPDYPWANAPDFAVLRHADTSKWYGLIMSVRKSRLGLSGSEVVDIMNIKCDPVLSGSLRLSSGFFPAYHMNKTEWLTILLDGSVDTEQIFPLLDMSFALTSGKKRSPLRITKWLVPANPKYYDIERAISESEDGTILWKQSGSVCVGDTVYLYLAAPVSAVRYQCQAVEVDIPYSYEDDNLKMKKAMRLKILKTYDKTPISFSLLKSHGVFAVRGPRSIPESLIEEIDELYRE